MAGTSDGGPSDYEVLRDTGKEADSGAGNNVSNGFGAIGAALAGNGGPASAQGENAFANGARIGAQTIDALAQAKDRITKNQQAEMAGQQFENSQFQQQLKISPEEGSYYATQARAGVPPQDIFASIKNGQSIKNRALIADPTADPNARRAALMAENPASADIHAAGDNGSYVDPMLAHYGTDATGATTATASPVSVSPLQTQLTQSNIGKNNAEGAAATTNAAANTTRANTAATTAQNGGKPPIGYHIVKGQDGNPVMDETGAPVLTFDKGGPHDPGIAKPEGAYQRIYSSNMVGSAGGVAKELTNMDALGNGANSGGMNAGPGHGGLLATTSDNLGRAISSTTQQEYKKSAANMGRFIGMIENGGRPTTTGAAGSAQEAVEAQAMDTPESALYSRALARQAVEAQVDRMRTSGAPPEKIAAYEKALDEVKKAVPYTPVDLIHFRSAPAGTDLKTWLKTNGQDAQEAAPAGGGDAMTALQQAAAAELASRHKGQQ
jgi:hypothetical protein